MKKTVSILIGFVHDFAAGCWAATVLAVYWLDRQNIAIGLLDALYGLKKEFFYLGLVCMLVVFATGAGRSFTYVSNVYGKSAEKARRRMLIYKHIILFAIFGAGTYWQYVTIFQ